MIYLIFAVLLVATNALTFRFSVKHVAKVIEKDLEKSLSIIAKVVTNR